jgi:hypothetical protein
MAIQDRNLVAGTELTAKYKGTSYCCSVEAGDDGLVFVLDDGRRFNSLSSGGSAIMGGKAVNGWRFWSIAQESGEAARGEAATKTEDSRARKVLYRLPNQKGVAEGKSRWFCNACMGSFLVDASETPAACPEGHHPGSPVQIAQD